MPILPAEPDLHPTGLWQMGGRGGPDARWWCLHTKPRQEKAVARIMRFQDISYYLPQVVKVDRTPLGRKIRSVIPLFPGYLFLLGNDRARIEAQSTHRLANVLEIVDQDKVVHDLEQIHRLLSSGLTVLPEPVMPVGSRVRITSGPLMGIEGTVCRRGKRNQFVAVVQFLGHGAAVDLEDWQVERLDDSGALSMRA
jgi:transcription antitermination factor NusG